MWAASQELWGGNGFISPAIEILSGAPNTTEVHTAMQAIMQFCFSDNEYHDFRPQTIGPHSLKKTLFPGIFYFWLVVCISFLFPIC